MQNIDNAKPAANASETEAAAGMSLLDAIAAFRAGSVIGARRSIDPARDRLQSWSGSARSRVEAIEALKLARDEALDFVGNEVLVPQMISVSISFLSQTDCPMSLLPSQDIAFALKVIEFFEPLRQDLEDQISVYDKELYDRFDRDFKQFEKWCLKTDYPFLNEQLDRLIGVIGEMTAFVRVRECRTVGDLLAKIHLEEDWVKLTNDAVATGYAEYAAEMLRSILPLTRRIGALPANETVSQQA